MWDSFWDYFWSLIVVFAFIAYLMVLFNILVDLFWRDHKTAGIVKAIWVVLLIVLPYLTAVVYLIARGRGMSVQAQESAAQVRKETEDYIKQAAGRSPATEIAEAKQLLDAGTISPAEFESLKSKALV
ncbi:membrane protein [Mycolicibacterium murale]|uniref:Membrane protein n=1 Tax=Mycolicibacterium murale TaxID=182220 RepID=A0A7I9WEK6_9MYCO|nr:SHOCT domain-containing protein [Mycolicibacterium murale]MCV7182298.1 SHOCT domain-containing protein [Mycolicibacterium murale]GFG56124.1 membrane protein [Mycolicibacterium murale]